MTNTRSASYRTTSDAPRLWVLGDEVRFMGEVEDANLCVLDVVVPPGSGTPPHRHASPEIFRVEEGEVTFGIFGDEGPRAITAGPGSVVTVPSWVAHNYRNETRIAARFTALVETEMRAFFEDIGSLQAPPPAPPSEAQVAMVMAACARHGIEVLGSQPASIPA